MLLWAGLAGKDRQCLARDNPDANDPQRWRAPGIGTACHVRHGARFRAAAPEASTSPARSRAARATSASWWSAAR